MKKLFLSSLITLSLLTGCDDADKQKTASQSYQESTSLSQPKLESTVAITPTPISQKEKGKLVKERYEDFNAKNKESYNLFLNLAKKQNPLLNFIISNLEKDKTFKVYMKEFEKQSDNTFKYSYTFKEPKSKFEITFIDTITFDEKLEKEGILAKIERRYDNQKLIKNLEENKLLPIDDVLGFFGVFNVVEYITFYADGRNLNHYILTPFTRNKLDNKGYKLEFNGLEAKRTYNQTDLNNPLFIGDSELFFKGLSYASNDNKENVKIEPFSINYSANKNKDKDNNINIKINDVNFDVKVNDMSVGWKIDKLNFSTKYHKFPTSIQDFIKIYYFPTSNSQIDLQGLSIFIDDNQKIKSANLYYDRIYGGDYSVIRENDYDLINEVNVEIKKGFLKMVADIVADKNNKKDKEILDFIEHFDVYKFSGKFSVPNLDIATLKHIEKYLDTFNPNEILYTVSALLNSLIKTDFNIDLNTNIETSLGKIKTNLVFKSNIRDKKILEQTFNLINSIKECVPDDVCQNALNNANSAFIKEVGKELIRNTDLKIAIDIDPRIIDLALKYDEKKEIENFFKKYQINPNQEKFIIEVKDMKVSVNNKLIEDFSAIFK